MMCKTAAMVKKNLAAVGLLELCATLLQWLPLGTSGTFFLIFALKKTLLWKN